MSSTLKPVLLLLLACLPLSSASAQETSGPAPLVYFDIAGQDNAAQTAFYSKLFNWKPDASGSFRTSAPSPLSGGIRPEQFNEVVVYIGVPDITAKLAEITEAGGGIEFPRFEVPGVVVLGMFKDPAGNRVGLVELNDDGSVKIP